MLIDNKKCLHFLLLTREQRPARLSSNNSNDLHKTYYFRTQVLTLIIIKIILLQQL